MRLTFLSRLDPDTTEVTVTGPDGGSAAAGEPAIDGKRVTVPFRAGPAGRYAVGYEVRSGDGHPIRGTVTFTLTSGAPPTPAVQAAPTPAATTTPVTATAVVAPPAEPVADEQGAPWWLWALGGVALVVLVGGGSFLLGRRG